MGTAPIDSGTQDGATRRSTDFLKPWSRGGARGPDLRLLVNGEIVKHAASGAPRRGHEDLSILEKWVHGSGRCDFRPAEGAGRPTRPGQGKVPARKRRLRAGQCYILK